jgi:hypothetical protein
VRKVSKYINLAQEIKDTWKLEKATVKPTVISEAATISHTLVHHLQKLQLHCHKVVCFYFVNKILCCFLVK